MPWKTMLAYVTGEVDQSLLLKVEYLIEENRVLRNQIDKRILLTNAERRILAEKAVALGKLMADTVTIVKPATIVERRQQNTPQTSAQTLSTPSDEFFDPTRSQCDSSIENPPLNPEAPFSPWG
jgi:hypothetical protein